jgi:hypothetical protein
MWRRIIRELIENRMLRQHERTEGMERYACSIPITSWTLIGKEVISSAVGTWDM